MSKVSNIFAGDSDSDLDIKTDNEYAKRYDVWRKREEFNKLKTKYGEDVDLEDGSSSSSDDDEEGIELTEKVEKDFFKTLACLKNKDPRIYDENVKFFNDEDEAVSRKERKRKEGPMYLKDYERNIILEKGGKFSDEENDAENRPKSPTYAEEQKNLRESLKHALNSVDEIQDEEGWGGLFTERKKTKEEKAAEEDDYKRWLAGQMTRLEDKDVETELKPLKDYWNNPELEEGEKFLRDYILNKKFLDKDEEDYIPTYEEIIHDSDQDLSNDEETVEKQEEFEHKYNFRFEEPDQEFIKRYPRTMDNSVRRKDDKRKLKRLEVRERKRKEKEHKMQEIKKLQELKRKEIEEKLEKLKEITGNTDLGFADEDIEGDFDPEAHDRRMQALFNDSFYEGPEDEQKPEFPDLDQELEIENWERYEGENNQEEIEENSPHCEDDNFNMDCDYDPNSSTQKELIEKSRGRKKRKRKSKFAEAVSKPKPKFDPSDKNYEKYFEEYYKLDCEDIIGDIPCRFKYRQVIPNDFGLTTEEILLAKERELNRWCSLKKAIQIRPDNIEKYDQIAYKKKGLNVHLKKRILPSLFVNNPEEDDQKKNSEKDSEGKISKKKKKGSGSATVVSIEHTTNKNDIVKNDKMNADIIKKRKKEQNERVEDVEVASRDDINTEASSVENKIVSDLKLENKDGIDNVASSNSKKKKKANNDDKINNVGKVGGNKKRKRKLTEGDGDVSGKKAKKNRQPQTKDKLAISDARLAAYGINPKKFKNKLKYGNR